MMCAYNNIDVRRGLIVQDVVLFQTSGDPHLPSHLRRHDAVDNSAGAESAAALLFLQAGLHGVEPMATIHCTLLHGQVQLRYTLQHVLRLHRHLQGRNTRLHKGKVRRFSMAQRAALLRLSYRWQRGKHPLLF